MQDPSSTFTFNLDFQVKTHICEVLFVDVYIFLKKTYIFKNYFLMSLLFV